jgi:serine/threonine protein kinase, bacterial
MPLADGQIYAGYTILRQVGAGGMGIVYLAQHPRLPRRDALKVLPAALTVNDEYRQRFNREADIASTLWHPHIVEVHDRGELDGRLWISMDFVDGTDAGSVLKQRYPNGMPPDEVVRIIRAVAEALDYAHEQQLLHRDVKPSNILLSHLDEPSERILLADFGVARWVNDESVKLTATNMTVGTVAYAAPEQLLGEHVDGRADQYALAASAFHMLTGTLLFQHSNPAVVISNQLSTPPPSIGTRRPALSDLGPVFSKALAKSPDDRYRNCVEFAHALANQLTTVAVQTGATEATATALPVSRPRRQGRPQGAASGSLKAYWKIAIALLVALTVIAVTLFVLHVI